jgi:hypothetical protein
MTKSRTQARVAPPAAYLRDLPRLGWFKAAVVAAVVVRVSADVPAVAPLIVTAAGESAQVAGSLAAAGVMAQVSATAPVNPPEGVTVIVEVLPVVAPGLTVMLPPLVRANAGAT